MHCCRIVNGIKNKNIKNSLGAKWNASHLACFKCADTVRLQRHVPTLWCAFWCFFILSNANSDLRNFVFRRRRAVFILRAMWWVLVRGWRRDCVVGGMETRFQWRKAHNPYAKCEAFHIAPRLFFMFLFLIPFTIRQHCIIYPQEFSTEPQKSNRFNKKNRANLWFRQMNTNYTIFFVESIESVWVQPPSER